MAYKPGSLSLDPRNPGERLGPVVCVSNSNISVLKWEAETREFPRNWWSTVV